jgi:aspartyl-tRNA(Asn)/glutamyl-tRNA(Gln) amidotransferase subunit A
MSAPIHHETAEELARSVREGARSAVEIARAFLARAGQTSDRLGTYLHLDPEGTLAQAALVDERRTKGEALGPLAGVPVAIKDNICIAACRRRAALSSSRSTAPPTTRT